MSRLWFILLLAFSYSNALINSKYRKFPDSFNFGAATSAYQVEGAWNKDGKSPSIWDEFTHRVPSPINNNDTGDIACDSYNRYKEDVRNAYNLGLQFYRISISWSRVLPNGYANKINEKGMLYYENLIKEILRYKMTPVVTLYHWDLPLCLYKDGIDWTNLKLVDVFVDYARIIIKRFPQVGRWTTINEPKQVCHFGYGTGEHAPGLQSDGLIEYQCSYVLLKVHAATYRMYKKEFPHYTARMGIVIDCQWAEPLTNSKADIDAANRQMQFECGMYTHPIFIGDWPQVVKDRIAERSKLQNLTKSRLPSLSKEEIDYIRGTQDYLGVNQYFTFLASNIRNGETGFSNYEYDIGVVQSKSPQWRLGANEWAMVPWGVRKVLNWLKQHLDNPYILLTEMGMADNGTLVDDDRIDFYTGYCCSILDAIYIDKVNVEGMTAWSLMDNFEWADGYTLHFGIYNIDFYKDPTLKRTPKKSVTFYQQMTKSRQLRCDKPHRKWPLIYTSKKKTRHHHHKQHN